MREKFVVLLITIWVFLSIWLIIDFIWFDNDNEHGHNDTKDLENSISQIDFNADEYSFDEYKSILELNQYELDELYRKNYNEFTAKGLNLDSEATLSADYYFYGTIYFVAFSEGYDCKRIENTGTQFDGKWLCQCNNGGE